MLRSSQSTATSFDPDSPTGTYTEPDDRRSGEAGAERRRHPRVQVETAADDRRQSDRRQGDRRQSDRRSIDQMRAEIQWTFAREAESRRLGNRLSAFLRRFGLKPSRILLLAVALISGLTAAYLAVGQNPRPVVEQAKAAEPAPQVIQEARIKVLVATQPIGIGQRLSADTISWQDWPEGSLLDDYVVMKNDPEAMDEMNGAVARFEFFPGDPIRQNKLIRDASSYLSAVLGSGMRAVSVSISATTASGGFISPNDHVDVVLTRGASNSQKSDTILHNVRVLAINQRLGETGTSGASDNGGDARSEMFGNQAIATLELGPDGAQVLIGASRIGDISLVLRSMQDFAGAANDRAEGVNQSIRLSSPFWTNTPGSGG